MAMDFFERQSVARRNTWWLVVMFMIAVVAIVVSTFVAAAVAVRATNEYAARDFNHMQGLQRYPWEIPFLAAGVLALGDYDGQRCSRSPSSVAVAPAWRSDRAAGGSFPTRPTWPSDAC